MVVFETSCASFSVCMCVCVGRNPLKAGDVTQVTGHDLFKALVTPSAVFSCG